MEDQTLERISDTVIFTPEAPPTGEDTGREQRLLRMSPNTQRAKKCAECILARPAFADERPGFTAQEISTCTNLQPTTVYERMDRCVAQGWLVKEEAGFALLRSTTTPKYLYRPALREDGQQLFVPKTKVGCERSFGRYTLERLTPQQSRLLISLARLMLERDDENRLITQAELRAVNPDLGIDAVSVMFRTLCRTNILEVIKKRENASGGTRGGTRVAIYQSTDRGMWLFGHVRLASQDMSLRESSPRPAKEQKNKQRDVMAKDIHAQLVEKVQANYAENTQAIIMNTIINHLNLKVLQGGVHSQECVGFKANESEALQFSPFALHHLGRKGSFAVAHFLGLDPILNGRWRSPAEVERMLLAPAGVRLTDFVKTRYYHPLLEILRSLD